MELFDPSKPLRLRSYHDKYLKAGDGEKHVYQDHDGHSLGAYWTVELVDGDPNALRLLSCYGRYLTATGEPFLLGVTGKKVHQTLPTRLDSSVEWEPIRDGFHVKLRTRYGNFLRANGGPPPWRNSVTHDVAHHFPKWFLWEVEKYDQPQHQISTPAEGDSVSSDLSSASSSGPIRKVDGRSIFYAVADDDGNVDESMEWSHLTFVETSLEELAELLKEETGLDEIVLCRRSPFNQQLILISLQLPPNNHDIRLVVVDANSSFGKSLMT